MGRPASPLQSPCSRSRRLGLLPVAAGVAAFWILFFGYTRLQITPRRALRWVFAPRGWQLFRTFRRATATRYGQVVLLRAPMFVVALVAHYYSAHAFGIRIPFGQLLTFLPVIFMVAALPVTVAHLGTTQAAWIFFFGAYAPAPRLLAFSLVAPLTFTLTRALLGLAWLPVAYADLTRGNQASARGRRRRGPVTSRAVSVMDDVGNDDLTYLISPRTCASPIFPVR